LSPGSAAPEPKSTRPAKRGSVSADWSAVIVAEPGAVWDALARLQGDAPPGRKLRRGRAGVRPRVGEWKRVVPGITQRSCWKLEPLQGGGTLVRAQEAWDGPMVRLSRRWMQRMVEGAVRSSIHRLRAEVEANRK
jgi:hypothetical protein